MLKFNKIFYELCIQKEIVKLKDFQKIFGLLNILLIFFLSFFKKKVSVIYISIVFKVLLLFKLNLNRKNCL